MGFSGYGEKDTVLIHSILRNKVSALNNTMYECSQRNLKGE